MTIQEVKRRLNIYDKDIACWFGYKDANSYRNSAGRGKIERGIVEVYKKHNQQLMEYLKKRWKEEPR